MVCACFYDENDNFRNKLWVLTSYDASRKEEDKLRKVVSDITDTLNRCCRNLLSKIGLWSIFRQ